MFLALTFIAPIIMLNINIPLSMALMLIGYAAVLGALSWLALSKWVGLSLILIYIGGMMVVFLYVTFLGSSFKIVVQTSKMQVFPLVLTLSLIPHLISTTSLKDSLPAHLFTSLNLPGLIFLIVYLLLALLVIVKLVESFKGALIKKF